jgi:ABC-type Mn2+/Zn2+ transport system permease subunit
VLGLNVALVDLALLGLLVVVCVAGLQAVGLILMVALLVLPPAAARLWAARLPSDICMWLTVLLLLLSLALILWYFVLNPRKVAARQRRNVPDSSLIFAEPV